jgi:hypothetical protein
LRRTHQQYIIGQQQREKLSKKISIKKVLFFTIWVVIGITMLTLLVKAMGSQGRDQCKDYTVNITGVEAGELFLTEKDVVKLMTTATNGAIKGQRKDKLPLQKLEQLLEGNHWVKDAELFFDNKDILHINVTERKPIARVFSADGRSFYIDDIGTMLPLSDQVSAKLPVFTGFIAKRQLNKKDSVLLNDMVSTAKYINESEFWQSQVSQIDIVACGNDCWSFDMIPLVGNHTVKLGDGKNIEDKFSRLMTFYKKVLKPVGFEKYQTVDVRFDGQVVGVKGNISKVDSIQLRRNIDNILKQSRELNEMMAVMPVVDNSKPLLPDAALGEDQDKGVGEDNDAPESNAKPVTNTTAGDKPKPEKVTTGKPPVKATPKPPVKQPVKPAVKPKPATTKPGTQPRAVMPPKRDR